MINESLKSAYEFIQLGHINDAIPWLERAAIQGTPPEEVAEGFCKLAVAYRQAGQLEAAIAALRKAQNYDGSDPGLDAILKYWQRHPPPPAPVPPPTPKQFRLQESWFYRFSSPIKTNGLLIAPTPVVVQDRVIVPDPSLQGFIALDLQTGALRPGAFVRPALSNAPLTHASTPVSVPPYLVLCIDRRVLCFDFNSPIWQAPDILSQPEFGTGPSGVPLVTENKVLFAFGNGIVIYDPATKQHRFTPLQWASLADQPRTPVRFNDEILVLSRGAYLHRLSLNGQPTQAIPLTTRQVQCGTPCICGDDLFFEAMDVNGHVRQVYCYALGEGLPYLRELTDEICFSEHLHFNHPPLPYQERAIISSDLEAKVYRVGYTGEVVIDPFEIHVQTGPNRVIHVSHIFSSMVGEYLVSKTNQGFFYINLENPAEHQMMLFHNEDEVIAQPAVYKDRILFLCRAGLRCYTIQQ